MSEATGQFVDRVRDEVMGLITKKVIPATTEGSRFVENRLNHLISRAGTPAFEHHDLRAADVSRVLRDVQIHIKTVALAHQGSQAPARDGSRSEEIDDLLPLLRRSALNLDLPQAIERAITKRTPLAVLFLDVDGFKPVNDSLGHLRGDEVLRFLASRLVGIVGHKGTAYRYGGDEFCVLLPNFDLQEAVSVAERIRAGIENDESAEGCTFSIGVAVSPDHGSDAATILKAADRAAYASKNTLGKNRVTVFGPGLSGEKEPSACLE
jgi:diguanylate cyclase (GGDEF)-like protein